MGSRLLSVGLLLAPLAAEAQPVEKTYRIGYLADYSPTTFPARHEGFLQGLRKLGNNAVEAAQLDDVNFHTLRHTFASWAVMRGVTLKELQELLGHASLAMTMRYAHLAPEHLRTAVSRLEGLTSSGPASASAQASAQEPVEIEGALQK